MGSMSQVRPVRPAAPPSRPALVTVLAGVWLIFAVLLAVGAVLTAARGAVGGERLLAALSPLFAGLFGAGAFGLLRRKEWARAALAIAGILAIALSAYGALRRVSVAAAPVAELAATEPDAANALALFRAGSAIAFLVSAIPLVIALSLLRHPTVRDWANPAAGAASAQRGGPNALVLVVAGAVAVAALSFFLSRKSSPSSDSSRKQVTTPAALAPEETFLWSDQPITFKVPNEPFTRERHAEGGKKGVSFTRYQVPPTRITVAEAFLQPAPNGPDEAIARLRLTRESFRSADVANVGDPSPATVGGAPAFLTEYAIRERSMDHVGKELVAVSGQHVFVFTFLGRPSDVPIFDALVASAAFSAAGGPEGVVRTADASAASGGAEPGGGEEIRVGEHRVSVRVPTGFERVDYGGKQEFRSGEVRIALVDGGKLPPGTGASSLEDDWLVQRALRLFEHNPKRWEVGAKTRITVGDREALVVDTREPLSHSFHQRTVVFVNGNRLLAGGMVMGHPESAREALDALAGSVRFLP